MAFTSNQFAVVEFPEEKSVEIVSTKWLSVDKKSCHWPNVSGRKFKALLLDHADPFNLERVSWNVHDCRVFAIYGKFKKHYHAGTIIFDNLI